MRLRGKRIFVVEDDPINRVVYHLIFVREGAVFDFERRGPDTMRRLLEFQPVDLVILDLMLPRGASGFSLFDEIHSRPEFARVPIIAVSSADTSEAIPKARQQGFSGYIPKPIDQKVFPDQLLAIMAGESMWYEV